MSPHYVESIATMPWPPPYDCTNVRVASMGLWTRYRLQAIVDEWLNETPSADDVQWSVLPSLFGEDLLLYQVLDYGKLRTTIAPWDNVGSATQREAYFCIPVLGWRNGIPVDFAYFLPYIWVSNPGSLSGGREVLGIPKLLGDMRCGGASTTSNPPPWGSYPITLDGPCFPTRGANGSWSRLVTVDAGPPPTTTPGAQGGSIDAADVAGDAAQDAGDDGHGQGGSGSGGDTKLPGAIAPPLGAWLDLREKLALEEPELELLDHLHGVTELATAPLAQGEYGLIHLRQLRVPGRPERTSYRGLVRCQVTPSGIGNLTFLPPATATFATCYDPALVPYLGIQVVAGKAPAIAPCAFRLDMRIHDPTVPWEECGGSTSASLPHVNDPRSSRSPYSSRACCWCAWPRLWWAWWAAWMPRCPPRSCGCRCH